MSGTKPPLEIPIPFGPGDVPQPWKLEELIRFRELGGGRVREARATVWVVGTKRFWMPILPCESLPAATIGWPSQTALGFQAVVDDPKAANSSAPYLIVPDLPSYGPARISGTRRNEVRKALNRCDFRILHNPGLLLDQGFPVLRAAAAASGQPAPASQEAYQLCWERAFAGSPPLVVAAVDDERLLAYVVTYGVPGHATLEEVVVPPWARPLRVGEALYWIHLRLWSAAPGVEFLTMGRSFSERPSLDAYKVEMGAEVVHLPAVSRLRAPLAWWLRSRRPHAYRRLTGSPLESAPVTR